MEKTQHSEKLLLRKLDLLLRTGKLLMESAADTSRIMRNMKRTAAYLGLPDEHLHIYINWNVLMVNHERRASIPSPSSRRCEKHGINLTGHFGQVSKLTMAGDPGRLFAGTDTRRRWNDIRSQATQLTPLGK